jgi:tetratricopeptide (TPR) repeat protein
MYMAHNFHMLTFAAMMQGESEKSLKTIRAMLASVPVEWIAKKENAAIADGFIPMPLEVMKRFGKWDDILKELEPPEVFPIARTMRHYNRGVAFAAKGKLNDAREAQQSFRSGVKQIPEDAMFVNNKAADLLAIAELTLEGEILLREGKFRESIDALNQAVAREDQLRYSEPPDWFVPVRHSLGAVLLRDNQAAMAEAVYREDLRRWPDNGWSLYGLAKALKSQGKNDDASKVEQRFKEVWKYADTQISSSCLCLQE